MGHSSTFHWIVFTSEQFIYFSTGEKLPKNSMNLGNLEKVAKNVAICCLIKKIDLLTGTLQLFINVPSGVILWI